MTKQIKELLSLSGKTSIVTGGHGHIGTAISECLAELGSEVIILGKRKDEGEKLAENLSSTYNVSVTFNEVDINSKKSIEQFFEKINKLDVLVNNAFTWPSIVKFEDAYKYPTDINPTTIIFNNQYKTFAVNWTPEKMDFYMNDSLMRTSFLKTDSLISMPIYIDMNIDQNQFCERVDTVNTVLPYNVEVDYIKVYQLKSDCNTAKTYCNTIATHDYKTYQSITIDGGSCTDVLNNKPNESFTASDYILFNQGFEAGSNVTAKFDVINCFTGQDFSDSRIANPPPYEIPLASWFERLIH